MKRCKKCGEVKPLGEFYKAKGAADGYRTDCKVCNLADKKARYKADPETAISRVKAWQHANRDRLNEYQREYRAKNQSAMREGHLRRTFGITQSDYDAILEMQRGGCAICGKRPGKISLHVDHDHATGEVRGLLCVGCNNALGQFHDDRELLARACDYIAGTETAVAERVELTGFARSRAGELAGSAV